MPTDWSSPATGHRDPRTGKFIADPWQGAQRKATGDFQKFSDYGTTPAADETVGPAGTPRTAKRHFGPGEEND